MKKTKHFLTRMSQRGIKGLMIEMVMELGEQDGDKVVFCPLQIKAYLAELDRSKKVAQKLLDKGGLVVVAEDGHLITTYHYGNGRRH